MTQTALWWLIGLVVVILIGAGVWRASTNDMRTDMATTTVGTTSDATTGVTGGAQIQGNLESGDYKLDTEASVLTWTGTKPRVLGYEDTGTVKLKSGTLKVVNGNIVSGDFFIDMDTIAVTKTSNTQAGADKLVNHLKSDDFFGIVKYPNAHFVLTSVVNGTVTGDLTIKNTTKTISFPAAIRAESATRLRAQAALVLDRANWDIRYGSDSFFDNLGDSLIADEVQIDLDLVATK